MNEETLHDCPLCSGTGESQSGIGSCSMCRGKGIVDQRPRDDFFDGKGITMTDWHKNREGKSH